uniref:ANK_REP_REGION domain-containing protein n=1 Tax=Ascaris lumbricoides TaxID=6252 RepID=A0A9J2Q343_ASCLU
MLVICLEGIAGATETVVALLALGRYDLSSVTPGSFCALTGRSDIGTMDSYLQHQMDFLEACSAGNMERTTSLLDSGLVDIEFRHRVNGWTGLHWAARRGHTDIVDLLLRAGFDPKAKSKQGKTPIDVAIEPSVKAILEEYSQSPSDASMEMNSASSGSPITPTRKQELYSYGRRDSLDRTRFLLVRTNFADGKEAFRRITLPGGGTVEHLKLTVERSMKMGRVAQVILLPDHIPIETQEQIRDLADCQKVEVVFEPNDDVKACIRFYYNEFLKGTDTTASQMLAYCITLEQSSLKEHLQSAKPNSNKNADQCWTARVCLSIYDMVRRCGAVVTRHIVRVNNNTRKLIGGLISSHRALVTIEHEMDSSSTGAPPTQRLHLNESNSSTYFCEIALASGNESKHASVDVVVFWCLLNCSRFGISSDKWLYFLSIVTCFVDEMEDYKRSIKPVADTKANRKGSLTEKTFSEAKTMKWRAARIQKTVSMNDEYMISTNDDSQLNNTQLNTSITLGEQIELETEHRADVDSSQLPTHIVEAESTLSDLSLRASSPYAEIATVLSAREVASSCLSESLKVPSDGCVEVLQNVGEHEINEQTIEENISQEIALANRRSCNQDVHLTVVSASNISIDGTQMECSLKEETVDIRRDIYASKSGKAQKVLSALIGDENDKYRPVKIALLAAGVVGVSGGIAYYLFVKVK